MTVSFEPVVLDSCVDNEAVLVFREGRLIAVVSRLGELHQELAGRWFVETTFDAGQRTPAHPFRDLSEVESWIGAPSAVEPQPA